MHTFRTCFAVAVVAFLLGPQLSSGRVEATVPWMGLQDTGAGVLTGRVTDGAGLRSLSGAQISIVGTNLGTITAGSGRYRLGGVPAGTAVVRVEMIGYETVEQEVTIVAGESTVQDFALADRAIELEGIVVTGTGGAVQRRSVGTVVEGVDEDDFALSATPTVADALRGQIPGMNMVSGGGSVGDAVTFEMRGGSSIVRGNQPVIYVDGVRLNNRISSAGFGNDNFTIDHLSNINPDDIARIEVLKGAAATTLYGTQASNGVIQIFTKSGSAGAPQFDVGITQGISRIPYDRVPTPMTYSDGVLHTVDPRDVVLRTGHEQGYNASVRGGSADVRYYVSGEYRDVMGPLVQNGLSQYSGRMNLNAQVVQELSLGVNAYYTQRALGIPGSRNNVSGGYANAILSVPHAVSESRPYGGLFTSIPSALQIQREVGTRHFVGGLDLAYAPRANFQSTLSLGIDLSNDEQVYFEPFGVPILGNDDGRREVRHRSTQNLTFDLVTTWSKDLGQNLTSRSSFGGQAFFDLHRSDFLAATGFPGPGLETMASAATVTGYGEIEENEVSGGLFVQEQMGYRDRLFVTAGLRLDGHSSFGESFGLQPYPKINASYVISEEDFWSVGWVPMLRLRAAYGTAGLAPGAFDAERTFVGSSYDGRPAIVPGTLGEPDLRPERSREIEVGFDAALLEDRVSLGVTYFDQETSDALVPRSFAPSGGFLRPQLVNAGTIANSGVELTTRIRLLERSNLTWDVSGSLATLNSSVDLGGAAPIRPGYQRHRNYFITGYAPSSFFGTQLNEDDPYTILAGGSDLSDFNSIDQIQVNVLQSAAGGDSLVYLGKPQADVTGDLSLDLELGESIRLRTSFGGALGTSTYNLTDVVRSDLGILPGVARIQQELADPSTSDDRKRELAAEYAGLSGRAESNWVEESDYLRWSEVGVRYRVPQEIAGRVLGARNLVLSLAGQNLLLFTDYRGSDPTTNADGASSGVRNADFIQAPLPRQWTLSIDVGF